MSRTLTLVAAITLLLFNPALVRADVVLDWNEIATHLPAPNGFEGARRLAIVQLAVFEAVNSITGEYEPYLPSGTVAPNPYASPDAAAVQAAHDVLKAFHLSNSELDALLVSSLALIPDGRAKEAGITTGHAAALAVLGSRVDDGSAVTEPYFPSSANPGEYQLPDGCTQGAFLRWGEVRPFGSRDAGDFILRPPPALDSVEYANDYWK